MANVCVYSPDEAVSQSGLIYTMPYTIGWPVGMPCILCCYRYSRRGYILGDLLVCHLYYCAVLYVLLEKVHTCVGMPLGDAWLYHLCYDATGTLYTLYC